MKDKEKSLRSQKEELVEKEILDVWRQYQDSGVSLKHVQKAIEYYLKVDEVLNEEITLDDFYIFLNKTHIELVKLALEVETNYIKELERYFPVVEKIELKEDDDRVDLTEQEKQVLAVINKVVREYRDKGLLNKHVKKAKEYYLSLVKENNKNFDEFLKTVEAELYTLADNTKRNYIEDMKNKILTNPKIPEKSKEIAKSNVSLVDDFEVELLRSKKEELVEKEILDVWCQYQSSGVSLRHVRKAMAYYQNANEVLDNTIGLDEFTDFLLKIHNELIKLALDVESNFIKELESYSSINERPGIIEEPIKENLNEQEKQVLDVIDKISKEYCDKGLLDKHIKKAKEYYFSLLRDGQEDFKKFLKNMEVELYLLAEKTKRNYIEDMKIKIITNPRISKESRERIEAKIFLSREEKELSVRRLIDSIAKEYSNDGVFERHIKKAYSIFLNKSEVGDSFLSLADFQKFLSKIEIELYQLAEQTKKNYEHDFEMATKTGKVLKKGAEL